MTPDSSNSTDLELDEKGLARLWVGTPGQAPSALSSDLLAAIEDRIIEIEAGAADGRIQVVIVLTRPAGSFLGGSDLRPLRGLTRATDAAEYAPISRLENPS